MKILVLKQYEEIATLQRQIARQHHIQTELHESAQAAAKYTDEIAELQV
jgi:hypothetical protein